MVQGEERSVEAAERFIVIVEKRREAMLSVKKYIKKVAQTSAR